MPWQAAWRPLQRPDYLPRPSRKSGCPRYISISGYFAFGNLSNRIADDIQHARAFYWLRYQASVRRSPCSSVYCGSWPSSERAAVVSA